MKLIFEDRRSRAIKTKEEIKFSSFSSYHLIIITAQAKSEKQLGDQITDDEDLTVKLDGKPFPKLGSDELIDSPAAFSGGRLYNLSKTVYFLTFLKGKDHKIVLGADNPPGTATFERLQIYALNPVEKLVLEPNMQAEDGDRRPWISFALDSLALKSITLTLTYSHRKRDSDDVKIKIDGKTQGNLLRTIKHFLWRFVGSRIDRFSSKTDTETFTVNLPQDLHYLEFDADRMPTLNKLVLDFGKTLSLPAGIPTVDNPKWTGSFDDDTEEMLMARMILGEAEHQSKEAKIGIAYTVLNRLEKQNQNWGDSVREIILKENQYDGMWNKNTYDKVRDPLINTSETRKQEWRESYLVAVGVISGSLVDPTSGATNFHSYANPVEFPSWATEKTYKTKLGDIYFYELER